MVRPAALQRYHQLHINIPWLINIKRFFSFNLSPSCFQTNFIVLVKTKARTSPYKDISVFSCTHASDRLQPSCLLPSRLPSSLHVWDMVLPDCVGMRSRRDYVCAQSLITSFRIDYYSSSLQSQRVTVEASKTLSCTAWRCHSVYMCVWVNVVKWSQACLLQSDRHFFPLPLSCSFFFFFLIFWGGGPVSSCLSHLVLLAYTQHTQRHVDALSSVMQDTGI